MFDAQRTVQPEPSSAVTSCSSLLANGHEEDGAASAIDVDDAGESSMLVLAAVLKPVEEKSSDGEELVNEGRLVLNAPLEGTEEGGTIVFESAVPGIELENRSVEDVVVVVNVVLKMASLLLLLLLLERLSEELLELLLGSTGDENAEEDVVVAVNGVLKSTLLLEKLLEELPGVLLDDPGNIDDEERDVVAVVNVVLYSISLLLLEMVLERLLEKLLDDTGSEDDGEEEDDDKEVVVVATSVVLNTRLALELVEVNVVE